MVKKQNQTRLTIADVAKAAGVSVTTVSHALNDRGQVDVKTREKVKLCAQKLGYQPNLRAQRLRTGRTNAIALLSAMPFSISGGYSRLGFMMEVAATAAEVALKRDLSLVLVPPLQEKVLLDGFDIDGAVIIEPIAEDPQVSQLLNRGVKLVSIGRQIDADESYPYVDLQSECIGNMLLEHLFEEGARNIALMIGSALRHSYVDIEKAYTRFATEKEMLPIIVKVDELEGESAARKAAVKLLKDHPEIDGVCAPVDVFAIGVVNALKSLGKQIPEEVKVVTRYDGLRAQHCQPGLTAVDLHLETVAELAVNLLFEWINGSTDTHCVLAPSPKLVVRGSSCPSVSVH